ncbi:hypothetical protein F2Q70_00011285 [Brassica cretica]|nr:hypothetical protein F2Q70_00011285 [Brassica cretica]
MERNPRIVESPSASLHDLTILPLAPRSVAKISSPVFDEILIHFRKSNDTQIETWITKTANIDSSLNTARKAEKSRKNLYSCYSKWADRHESSRVLRYFRLEIRLGIFVGNY